MPDQSLTGLVATELPRDPTCAAQARAFVREHLEGRASEPVLERVLLIASELATNAWKHGEGMIELRLRPGPEWVHVEVGDEGEGTPAIRERSAEEHGGWGLRIVDTLAVRWGCYEGTTHVWADLAFD